MEFQTDYISNEKINKQIANSNLPMNSMGILLPCSYALELVNLNFHDILFGVENGYLPYQTAIEHAKDELEHDDSKAVLELASLSLAPEEVKFPHSIHPFIDELANSISEDERNQSINKLLFIVLKWLYEHKENYEDPLMVVEVIYADFGYPKSMIPFVRYMPMSGPDIFAKWKDFLDEQGKHFLLK